jgi:hypothetical protein
MICLIGMIMSNYIPMHDPSRPLIGKISCTHKFLPILYGCPPEIYQPEVEAGTAYAGGNPWPGAPRYRCKKCKTEVMEIE